MHVRQQWQRIQAGQELSGRRHGGMAMNQYVVINSQVYPADTQDELDAAMDALRASGLKETRIWHVDATGEESDEDRKRMLSAKVPLKV